jgi:hypothetical protein
LPTVESALKNFSPNNKITPANPIINPAIIDLLRKFFAQFRLSKSTNQIGEEDTIMATTPLGKYCSTQITAPVPINNISTPLIAACLMLFITNICSPFNMPQPNNIIPAKRKRIAPSINGGNPSMAFIIKKYVEPHTM